MFEMRGKNKIAGSNRGYSLVEVLVSSMIFTFSVGMVSTMIWKGKEIEHNNFHYQRARCIADSCLENRAYHFTNYDLLQGHSGQIVIDEKDGFIITGTLTITVSPEKMEVGNDGVPAFYKEITGTVTWMEYEGEQSFSLTKRITRL
jgi:hypothetical protein